MYKIEKATIDEYTKIAKRSIENGKCDYAALKECQIDKLVYNDEILVLLGRRVMTFDEYPGKKFILVSGVFNKSVKQHVRVLLEVGEKYLNVIQKYPLIALASSENAMFNKFLKQFGFVYTNSVANMPENDIVYNVYVRY